MLQFLVVFLVLIILLAILITSVELGRVWGRKQIQASTKSKLEVVTVAESSVFALLGLLIAFTFSGAYGRFEERKLHLLQEADAYDRAYHYVDLVAPEYDTILREKINQYLDLHLAAYRNYPYIAKVQEKLNQSVIVEEQLWQLAVKAALQTPNQDLAQLFIASINNMFEQTHFGINLTRVHPPAVVFLLMICLAALGGFLIGYDSAENKQKRPIHIICYILITSITIYIIFNLEFPRTGFISFNYFDRVLLDVRNHTNSTFSSLFPF